MKLVDEDTRTMLASRYNKVIGKFKLDMMGISISTAEATALNYAKIAKERKDQMMLLLVNDSNAENDIDKAVNNNLIHAIEARQENIIKRAQYITACTMPVFEGTPMLIN